MTSKTETTDDAPCTCCQGSGWNGMAERVCACQPPSVGENSPAMDDDALAAELAADPAIAASLAEWERTSGPPQGEYSPKPEGGTMRPLPSMVADLRGLAKHIYAMDSGSGEAALLRDAANYIEGATDSLREHMDLLRAARAVAPRWQPIETAPKDGAWVLLTGGIIDYGWDGKTQPPCVVGQSSGDSGWQFAWYDSGYYGGYEQPTHWMPAPEDAA